MNTQILLNNNHIRKDIHCKKYSYDVSKFKFRELFEELIGCKCQEVHKYLGNFTEFERKDDQMTLVHRVYYSNFNKFIYPTYIRFISEFVSNIIKEPFYYQLIPTLRVGLPGNKFVGEYHKDSYYNHQSYELNFNLGIAGYTGNRSLRVESEPGSNQYINIDCPYGTIFSFDHIDCMHGSDINKSDLSMISIDFRLALKNLYYESNSKSVNTKTVFKPGSYFSLGAINDNDLL